MKVTALGFVMTREISNIVDKIRPLLAGREPKVQGVVLADCLAIWLAGHEVEGGENATRKLRAELLTMHCYQVRNLTTLNAKIMGTTL